jgi:phosphatidylglycerophosphatase A
VSLSATIATLAGLGRLKPAPGTIASIAALLLAWPLARFGGPLSLPIGAALATVLGWWASGVYARARGMDDPSDCVIDELAGQWIACAFVHTLPGYGIAFVLFRLLDITKPWPISAAERLPGGLGIMADDVVAGLAAGLAVLLLARLGAI